MDKVGIEYLDETYIKIHCDSGIAQELFDYFSFFVPGYKFMPAYRNKIWNGKVNLFNTLSCTLFAGLRNYVEEFCTEREYQCEHLSDFSSLDFSPEQAKDFARLIKTTYEPKDYQIDCFVNAVRNRRSLSLSPTASGKSFMIYLITRFYNKKTLIIVPTTALVQQMQSDFVEYGLKEGVTTGITAGKDKNTDHKIVVTTWQSCYKMSKEWFARFDVVIGDEAHLFAAKSVQQTMLKLNKCKYRFGFTGTLDGTKTHRLVLEGLFGPVFKVTTTAKLIEQKHLADFKIRCILLQYADDVRKSIKGLAYKDEIDFIVGNKKRNEFIKNLALSLKGNTLILYNYVEKHGVPLYKLIKDAAGDRPVYFVSGSVNADDREAIRRFMEDEENAICVASLGTFSTGTNIKRLHNLVFASPSKSRIRTLQSIGRVLRKMVLKGTAILYDIADDLSWKTKQNHTLKHFVERVKIYNEERFEYKIDKVTL